MKRTMIAALIPSAFGIFAALSTIAPATAADFSIGKGSYGNQELATVESVADFETFTGRTNKVTGTITGDPKKHIGSGVIDIDVASIDTGLPLRNTHMNSEAWLDSAKYPTIHLVTTKVAFKGGDKYLVTGKLTLHGVTKTITVPATVKYIAQSPVTQSAGFKGDVLHIDTTFNIKLSDYNITVPAQAAGKVAPTVKIGLSAYASSGS